MPYDVAYDETGGGAITRFSGVVTARDLQDSIAERWTSDRRAQEYRYLIDDFSAAERFELSAEDVRAAAARAGAGGRVNPDIVLVHVLPRDLEYGMGRAWQVYAEASGWRTRVVRSRDEADAWVREQLDRG